jgi:Swiss Army Knife RNA repair-like protein
MPHLRPLLLLDVDGVLNPLAVQPPGHVPAGFGEHHLDGLRVLLSPDHGAWLTELAGEFDLVWATSWEHDADRLIAELIGLPRGLPVITFDSVQTGWLTKLPDVVAFVGDRPLAWVDDKLDADVHAWAETRVAPTLLVEPDHAVGLAPAHIAMLRTFAEHLRTS